MTFIGLLVRNLLYHWRGNLAVFMGIALGSAVLTGALLVGDSLRGSLKALTLERLGWVEQAMLPGRFFRAALANELPAERHAAALLLQGSASRKGAAQRVGRVNVLGVDASFWLGAPYLGTEFWDSHEREVVLNRTLATALDANVGDTVTLHLQRADKAPAETLMGSRKAERVIEAISLKVRDIVPDEGMARFSLKPTPEPVRNAFVPLRVLQNRLDLAGQANAILVAGAKDTLADELRQKLTLADWGLRYLSPKDRAIEFIRLLDPKNFDDGNIKKIRWREHLPEALADKAEKNNKILTTQMAIDYYEKNRDYSVLESTHMLVEPVVVQAVKKLTPRDDEKIPRWRTRPILVYLADTLSDGKHEVPYVIIAADDQKGPADDDILLTSWPGSPFKVKPGDKIKIAYYSPDESNHLQKRDVEFKVGRVDPLEGKLDDPDLTPSFPGITDQLDIANWDNPPFPFDRKRIKKTDEDYWKRYRATPRAYMNLKRGQELWSSRFGDLTSIQFPAGLEQPDALPKALLAELSPEKGGFAFQPVREQAVSASSGSSDFGVLFLAFSFFLIVAALLLVGLLVRLNLDRRAGEVGLLLATGWTHGQVRRLLLGEGAILSVVGAFAGLGGALAYGYLMLLFLAANWPGGESLNFLRLYASPVSLAIGYASSLIVSLATLYWATRVLGQLSPRSLLAGATTQSAGLTDARPGWSRWLVPICFVGAVVLAIAARFFPSHAAQAGTFFGSGALLLTACIAGVWNGLKQSRSAASPQPALWRLGLRNAGRHAVRSVLTVGLLASASFLIVAVESFHKDTDKGFYLKTGGSGGYAFYAEGAVPVFEDLNRADTRRDRLDTPELRRTTFYPCRVQLGDDTSCLNLYKPLKPRVMGLSKAFIERGGFHFGATKAETDTEKANPWRLLERKPDDAIPAIIDANTATYILKVGLGDVIEVDNDKHETVQLRVVALLQESIFQSEVLIAEENFLKLFPRQQGFTFFLIDVGNPDLDAAKQKTVEEQLMKGLADFNLDVQTTASRLQGYLAVENTYLQTFQLLGGLGLMLGAVGLAIVLLRGVWERRAELALLLALGFRSGQLAWLVLVENAFLLALGLAAGTASALLAVAPHLAGASAHVLWLRIALLLLVVLAVGLVSAALAVWSTLRTPVLTALRRE